MLSRSIRNRLNESNNIWPGFVDILATLLIVIIFVLMIFTVSQIYLSDAISGRDRALEDLRNQINELSKILIFETKEKEKVLQNLSETQSKLETEEELTLQLEEKITEDQATITTQNLNISLLSGQIEDLLKELKIVANALQTFEGIESTIDTKGLGEKINKALAARIDQLNLTNKKLALSQQETAEQLSIVNQLNKDLLAINESLGLEDADLSEQLSAINKKNEELALANSAINKKNEELALANSAINKKNEELALANKELEFSQKQISDQLNLMEQLNQKLSLNEQKLEMQVLEYQKITEELIALNENLDLKDQSLIEQLELIKLKNSELLILNEELIQKDSTIFDLRGKIVELNNILSLGEEKQLVQQTEIENLSKKLSILEGDQKIDIENLNKKIIELEEERQEILESTNTEIMKARLEASSTLEQVKFLSNEIEILKKEINTLNSALEASEQNVLTKELKIEVLGERLNKALTSKVLELQKYRSEFFGRLQALLGEREDIKVVGDRFIFESELLFDSGSATLQSEGELRLKQIGMTLKETTNNIPEDIDWIIQVEGHTDKNPINTIQFPSNWELSTARANSVLKLLLELGFDPSRLAAAGYGEFYPISEGDTNADFEQNRRIELRLTSR